MDLVAGDRGQPAAKGVARRASESGPDDWRRPQTPPAGGRDDPALRPAAGDTRRDQRCVQADESFPRGRVGELRAGEEAARGRGLRPRLADAHGRPFRRWARNVRPMLTATRAAATLAIIMNAPRRPVRVFSISRSSGRTIFSTPTTSPTFQSFFGLTLLRMVVAAEAAFLHVPGRVVEQLAAAAVVHELGEFGRRLVGRSRVGFQPGESGLVDRRPADRRRRGPATDSGCRRGPPCPGCGG